MWRQKDIMEKGRLEKRLKSYEREVMRYAHIIDREKRAIIRDFEAVRRTSGNSDLAIPPNGQRDNIYAESSYSKSGFRLSEKRLMEWKLSEKELERFLKRTQVGRDTFPHDTSHDNRRPKTSIGRNSNTNNGFINGRRPRTGVLTLTGQYPEIQSQAKIFRLYLNNDGIESKLEYRNKDEKTLRLDKSHFIKIPANGYIEEEVCLDLNDQADVVEQVATAKEQPDSDDDKIERSPSRRSMKSACNPTRRSRCRSRVDLFKESKEVSFPRSRRLSRSSNSSKIKEDRAASMTRIYSSPSRRSSLDSPRTSPKRRNGSTSRKGSQSMDARRSSSSLKRADSVSKRSSTIRNPICNSDENLSNKAESKQKDLGNEQDFTENKDPLSNQNPESKNLQICGESHDLPLKGKEVLKCSELSSFGEKGQFNSSNAADLRNSDHSAENPQKPRRESENKNIRHQRFESIQTRKRLGKNPQSFGNTTNTLGVNSRHGYVESVSNSNKNVTIMESPHTSSRYSPPAIGIYMGKSQDPDSSHQQLTSEEPVFCSDSEEPQLDLVYPDKNISRRSKRHVIRKARYNLHNKARKGGLIGSKSNEQRIIPSVKRKAGRGSVGGIIKPSQHNSRNFDSNDRDSKPSIPSASVTTMNPSASSIGGAIRRTLSSSPARSHPSPHVSSAGPRSPVASSIDVPRPQTSSTIGARRSPPSTTPITKRPSTSSNLDTTRPPTSSDRNTTRPSTSSNRNTTRPPTSSNRNTTRPSTSSELNATRPLTSSDRPSTSSRRKTTRPSTSAIRDLVIDQLASLGDGNIIPLPTSPSDKSRPTTSSTRQRKWNSDVCIDYPPAIHAKNNISSVFKVAMVFSKSARKTRLNKLVDEFSPDLRQIVREERLTELKSRSSQLSSLASQFNIDEQH